MAKILSGEKKGTTVGIHQWCNDWVMTNDSEVRSVTALQYTQEEFDLIINHNNNGCLFEEFIPDYKKLRFKRKKNK